MAKWSDCAICGRAIPLGELCYGIKNWKGDPEGGETICKDCLVPENAPTLTQPNEWVIVGERLPEKKQDVLMLFGSGNMAVGWLYDIDEHTTFWCAYTDDGFYTGCDCAPTHWMLLPKPPKEGIKNENE